MSDNGFVNLHNHSDYSILDGYSHPGEYIKRAAELGQTAVGLTDHGNLFGAFEFIKAARAATKTYDRKNHPQEPMYVKPIIGIEAYMAPQNPEGASCKKPVFYSPELNSIIESRQGSKRVVPNESQNARERYLRSIDVSSRGAYTHLTLFAINDIGFHNLIRLSTEANKREHFYMHGRMDFDMLTRWNEGIIATTGCPSGEIQTRLRLGQVKEAYDYAERMAELFDGRYYVEIMSHDMTIDLERDALPKLVRMAEDLKLPLLATNDSHYTHPDDAVHHEEMLCIQTRSHGSNVTMNCLTYDDPAPDIKIGETAKGEPIYKPRRFAFNGRDYYLKSYDEMIAQFPDEQYPDAVSNTVKIADMVGDWWVKGDGLELDTLRNKYADVLKKTQEEFLSNNGPSLPHATGGRSVMFTRENKGVAYHGKTDDVKQVDAGFVIDELTQALIDDGVVSIGPYDMSLNTDLRPEIQIPEGWTEEEWFKKKINEGFIQRRVASGDSDDILEESKRRIADEYPVFAGKNFIQYMLVVQDYINWARTHGVSVGEGRGCFLPGSKVRVGNGVMTNIEDVRIGSRVRTHDTSYHEVEDVFKYDVVDDDCVEIELSNGQVINCTADHLLFGEHDGFRKAETFNAGDVLLGPVGHKTSDGSLHHRVTVLSTHRFKYTGAVYDIQVRGVHNYTVGDVTVHNSVGGSEIAYLMDISRTDPVRHDLIFERFLNPERNSPPDVDTDFQASRRNRVLQYVKDKYGYDKVANIITFGTFKFKQAFRDVAKIYEMSNDEVDKISKLIPEPIDRKEPTMEDLYDENSPFYDEAAEFRETMADEKWAPIIKSTSSIVSRVRQTGTHACGVIMSSKPISDYAPLYWTPNEKKVKDNIWIDCMVGWEYPDLESLGLIKMDFLPLSNLDIIDNAVDNIKAYNETVESRVKGMRKAHDDPKSIKRMESRELTVPQLDNIEIHGLEDPETYAMLSQGDSDAVFQLSSDGQKTLLRKIEPDNFEDIVAINALYRPGPMGQNAHLEYADRKNGRAPSYIINERLDAVFRDTPVGEILAPTYSLMVYQEQIMQISRMLAGFTRGQADSLRKAMGHKIPEEMEANHKRFVDGAMTMKEEKGYKYSRDDVEELWKYIEVFSAYSFNRCVTGDTQVTLDDGRRATVEELWDGYADSADDVRIMGMWYDGVVRPSRVSEIVKMPERREVWTVVVSTPDGMRRHITITGNHRMLTNLGYRTIEDGGLRVGVKVLVDHDWARRTRTGVDVDEFPRANGSHGVDVDDANATLADAVAGYLDMRGVPYDRDYGSFPIMGGDAKGSSESADFRLHNGSEPGVLVEVDDRGLGKDWFIDHKYGSIGFVYVDPDNYRDAIDSALMGVDFTVDGYIASLDGAPMGTVVDVHRVVDEHGEPVMMDVYDIGMDDRDPSNFIANGLVSHNSHSVSYAINAYKTAYLKTHYFPFFMASVLTENLKKKDKFPKLMKNAVDNGLVIGQVNVNTSSVGVTAAFKTRKDDPDIVFGFDKASGVNSEQARSIVDARNRNGGSFSSLDDFMMHVPTSALSTTGLEGLANAGAFDVFGLPRKAIASQAKEIVEFYKKKKSVTKKNSVGLLGLLGASGKAPSYDSMGGFDLGLTGDMRIDEYAYGDKLREEKKVLGVYVSSTPLSNAGPGLKFMRSVPEYWRASSIKSLQDGMDESVAVDNQRFDPGKTVRLIGYFTNLEKRRLKSGDGYWYSGVFTDETGSVDMAVGSKAVNDLAGSMGVTLGKGTEVLYEDVMYDVDAQWLRDGRVRVNAIEPVRQSFDGRVPLTIRVASERTVHNSKFGKIIDVMKAHPGDVPVVLDLEKVVNQANAGFEGVVLQPGLNTLPFGVDLTDEMVRQMFELNADRNRYMSWGVYTRIKDKDPASVKKE